VADLAKDGERPALSPEGLLRALGVIVPASGLGWERWLRLVVLGDDCSHAQPFAAIPEAGFGGVVQAAVVAEFSTLQIQAGRRGAWVPTVASSGGVRLLRFDSGDAAQATSPMLLPVVVPFQYQINGAVEAVCSVGTVAATGGPGIQAALLGSDAFNAGVGRIGWWVPPGGVIQFIHTTANVAATYQQIVREPLGAP